MGQFSNLFKGLENAETAPPPQAKAKTDKTAKSGSAKKAPAATAAPPPKTLRTATLKPEGKKRSGDTNAAQTDAPAPMRGKRSHPDYTQAPAFVRKDTYKAVKIALLNDERGLDYSDLIEQLLRAWLRDKNNR